MIRRNSEIHTFIPSGEIKQNIYIQFKPKLSNAKFKYETKV